MAEVKVVLPTNVGGYKWQLVPSTNYEVVKVTQINKDWRPGSGYNHEIIINTLVPEPFDIKAIYKRAWEPEPVETLTIHING